MVKPKFHFWDPGVQLPEPELFLYMYFWNLNSCFLYQLKSGLTGSGISKYIGVERKFKNISFVRIEVVDCDISLGSAWPIKCQIQRDMDNKRKPELLVK